MNQCVKRGAVTIVILLIILLPLNLVPLTDDRLSRFVTLNGRFSGGDTELSSTLKGKDFSEVNLSVTTILKKQFGEDKLAAPKALKEHVSEDKPLSLHGFSQGPLVKENNDTVMMPDKLPSSIINHVKMFVFFLGHEHSGHSIVGSLMDSHPHMVISHEFDLFNRLSGGSLVPTKAEIFNALWMNSKETIINDGVRTKSIKGYTLLVDGLYQGKYMDHIDVIGDKKGYATATLLADQPQIWLASFNIIKSLELPMKVIHVIRNPYDNIATSALFMYKQKGESFGEMKRSKKTFKVKSNIIDYEIHMFFALFKQIVDAKKKYNLDIIEIHSHELISDPRGTLFKVCNSLEVTCSNNYLEICSKKIFKNISKTRHLIQWTDGQLNTIQWNIDKYNSLKDYNFDSV